MIKLKLTSEIITKQAQEKLDKFREENKNPGEEPKDEHNRSAENYRDLGLKVPEDLLAAETRWIKSQEGESPIELLDEDFELILRDVWVRPERILFVTDDFERGSTVYLDTDQILDVAETARQVYNKIEKYNGNTIK